MKPHRILLHGQQQLKRAAAGDRGAAATHPPPLAENRSYTKQQHRVTRTPICAQGALRAHGQPAGAQDWQAPAQPAAAHLQVWAWPGNHCLTAFPWLGGRAGGWAGGGCAGDLAAGLAD